MFYGIITSSGRRRHRGSNILKRCLAEHLPPAAVYYFLKRFLFYPSTCVGFTSHTTCSTSLFVSAAIFFFFLMFPLSSTQISTKEYCNFYRAAEWTAVLQHPHTCPSLKSEGRHGAERHELKWGIGLRRRTCSTKRQEKNCSVLLQISIASYMHNSI